MANKIRIFEESISLTDNSQTNTIEIFNDSNCGPVKIFDPGPKGDKGDRGETGFSGAGEPFFVIVSGSLYGTTGSLAILADFSSSLIPYTGSNSMTTHALGSLTRPWRNVYLSESIFIVKNGVDLVSIRGSSNTVSIGQSQISTSSFGFDDIKIINRITNNQQTFQFISSSVSSSFNEEGVFTIPDFSFLPTPYEGGLIKSGSNLFFGI